MYRASLFPAEIDPCRLVTRHRLNCSKWRTRTVPSLRARIHSTNEVTRASNLIFSRQKVFALRPVLFAIAVSIVRVIVRRLSLRFLDQAYPEVGQVWFREVYRNNRLNNLPSYSNSALVQRIQLKHEQATPKHVFTFTKETAKQM